VKGEERKKIKDKKNKDSSKQGHKFLFFIFLNNAYSTSNFQISNFFFTAKEILVFRDYAA